MAAAVGRQQIGPEAVFLARGHIPGYPDLERAAGEADELDVRPLQPGDFRVNSVLFRGGGEVEPIAAHVQLALVIQYVRDGEREAVPPLLLGCGDVELVEQPARRGVIQRGGALD